MTSKPSIEKLYSLQRFGIKLGLQNIERLLKYIGDPQKNFKSIHIAGSNGKGSTVSFIASILVEAGFKTGIYTSPHFVNFNERIRVNSIEIPDEYIEKFITDIEPFIDENNPTFFEVTTAMAFKYFSDQKVEYAVVETGLGGKYDATNCLLPEASVITSISLEHTEYLGNTIESIAEEKAGIIKKGRNVFIGRLPEAARKVIINQCNALGCKLFEVVDYIKDSSVALDFSSPETEVKDLTVPLFGHFQKYNAALAVLTVSKSAGITNTHTISRGLQNVVINSGIQGRYEIYNESPRVIFDSAHNIEGVETFISAFNEEYKKFSHKILLFGAMRDKRISEMLGLLKKNFNEIRFVHIDIERCSSFEELDRIGTKLGIKYINETDPSDYINQFINSGKKDDCVVLLGSMYILGKIKAELLYKKKA